MKKPMEFTIPVSLGEQIGNSIKSITANRIVVEELDKTLSDRLDELARNIRSSLLEKFPQDAPLRRYFNEWQNNMFLWIRGSLHFSGEEICWKDSIDMNDFEIAVSDLKDLSKQKHVQLSSQSLRKVKVEMMNLLNKSWEDEITVIMWAHGEDALRFRILNNSQFPS
jgi:hypothetical protein